MICAGDIAFLVFSYRWKGKVTLAVVCDASGTYALDIRSKFCEQFGNLCLNLHK